MIFVTTGVPYGRDEKDRKEEGLLKDVYFESLLSGSS